MKERLKSIAAIVCGLLVFGACNVMPLRSDYTWASSYAGKVQVNGWRFVFEDRSGSIDITRPWQIIWPPPYAVYFIRPDTIELLPQNQRRVGTLEAYRSRPPIEEFESIRVFDCDGARYHILETRFRGKTSSGGALEWHPISGPGTPLGAMLAAACSG